MSSKKSHLKTSDFSKNPVDQFDIWYREHLASSLFIPDSFSLATSSAGGQVSLRMVLLKEYNHDGFVFFTNYESKKGLQISENPKVAMLFYWPESSQQVRIEGHAVKIAEEDSFKYFSSRPRESQIGAWASRQGAVIPGREFLEKQFSVFEARFRGNDVPKPPYWGGYRITPSWFEFWQEGEHRLHDRIAYFRAGNSWKIRRLSP